MDEMNIAQRVKELEQIEERIRKFAADKVRTKEELQLVLLDEMDALHNVALALAPRDPYDAAPTEWGIPV